MTEHQIVEVRHYWDMEKVNNRMSVGWVWLSATLDTDGDVIHVIGRPQSVAKDAHDTGMLRGD